MAKYEDHATLGFSRNDELDQERPITLEARGQETGQLFQRFGARRFYPHAGSETDPVQRRIFEVEQIECGAARIGADLGQLVFQNGIPPVGENHRSDIKILAGLRPKSLDRIESRAVALEIDYPPARRCVAAPVASGSPLPMAPPVSCSQPCGAASRGPG